MRIARLGMGPRKRNCGCKEKMVATLSCCGVAICSQCMAHEIGHRDRCWGDRV